MFVKIILKGISESHTHMYHTNTKLLHVHHTHTDKHVYIHKNIHVETQAQSQPQSRAQTQSQAATCAAVPQVPCQEPPVPQQLRVPLANVPHWLHPVIMALGLNRELELCVQALLT